MNEERDLAIYRFIFICIIIAGIISATCAYGLTGSTMGLWDGWFYS